VDKNTLRTDDYSGTVAIDQLRPTQTAPQVSLCGLSGAGRGGKKDSFPLILDVGCVEQKSTAVDQHGIQTQGGQNQFHSNMLWNSVFPKLNMTVFLTTLKPHKTAVSAVVNHNGVFGAENSPIGIGIDGDTLRLRLGIHHEKVDTMIGFARFRAKREQILLVGEHHGPGHCYPVGDTRYFVMKRNPITHRWSP
jgi:hypothetical protein